MSNLSRVIKSIQRINPGTLAPPGGHYSHAVVANGFLFVSGQLPITPAGEKLNQASFEDQAKQVLANVQAALEAAGSSVAQLVQVPLLHYGFLIEVEAVGMIELLQK